MSTLKMFRRLTHAWCYWHTLSMTDINDVAIYQMVGEQLRRRRIDLGLSQADLGEAVGMLRTSIANIEAGRQRPPLHMLYRLCAALGLEVAEIIPSQKQVSFAPTVEVQIDGVHKAMSPKAADFLRQLLDE